eukprot:COSAG06_NODE_182_length_20899_cov_89.175048_20_plen_146_part_00
MLALFGFVFTQELRHDAYRMTTIVQKIATFRYPPDKVAVRAKIEPLLRNTNVMQFFLERLGEVCAETNATCFSPRFSPAVLLICVIAFHSFRKLKRKSAPWLYYFSGGSDTSPDRGGRDAVLPNAGRANVAPHQLKIREGHPKGA